MVIAVFVLGPDRLPMYAKKLAQLVKSVKQMASGAKERMRDEMGPEFDEVDWKKLDPRQYDPRRIIRDALIDDDNSPEARRARAAKASAERQAKRDGVSDAAAAGAADAVSAPKSPPTSASARGPMAFDEEAT